MKIKMKRLFGILLCFILVLGLMPGMSMTVNAAEQVITCTGTYGNLLNMFEGSGITYTVGNGMNEAQFYKNGKFTAPEGKCFTKIQVAYGDTYWGGFTGRALTVTHGNAIVVGDDGTTLKIEFTVDDLAIYNVTLNTNGGTVNDGNITTYTEFYGATLPTNVTRNGYIFEGWYDNAGLTGEPVTSIASDATGNKEYWAKWESDPSSGGSSDSGSGDSSGNSSSNDSNNDSSNNNNSSNDSGNSNSEPKDETPFDYLDPLREDLKAKIALGGERTVTWDKGTALPYDIMKTLQDNPGVTLIFSYTYQGIDYKVTISGKDAKAYTEIPWYGPLYLYKHYGSSSETAPVNTTDTTTGERTYTVIPGDTLIGIAGKLNTTVESLVNLNDIKNRDFILVGQILKY